MKLLIIGFSLKNFMPFIYKYEKILLENDVNYDVFLFDRTKNDNVIKNDNIIYYNKLVKSGESKLKKIIPYIGYKKHLTRVIKSNKYEKFIVLTTPPAVFINKLLIKKYRNSYIFDYRDYSHEKIKWYKNNVDNIIKNSYCTFISSKGFMDYLNTSDKIYISHNINSFDYTHKPIDDLKNKNNINIGFVGYVRYYNPNIKLIYSLRNSDTFSLSYYGEAYNGCDINEYCRLNDIKNVKVQSYYENKDKYKIYESISIINALYDVNSEDTIRALPNRLYDAAIYKKPILVSKGTYLAELVLQYGIGLCIDVLTDDIEKALNEYIEHFSIIEFQNNCNRFLEDIKSDEIVFERKIADFVNNI
jgi:hypothetical protein